MMDLGEKIVSPFRSHGDGKFKLTDFASVGSGVIFENGVLVFHPENIRIGNNVYVGHYTILKGYYKNEMVIDDGVWIGQQCFLHSAGGLHIGRNVGIGPGVKIITSCHGEEGRGKPILHSKIVCAPVRIGSDADIGINACILPGVTIGCGAQVGAGAVVTHDIPDYEVWAGVPARKLRTR